MWTRHNPPTLQAPRGFSHGVEVSGAQRLLFVSGQVGQDAAGAIAEGVEAQTGQALENLTAVLAAAGMAMADVAKLTVFLTDPADLAGFSKGARAHLPNPPVAITLVYVKALIDPALKVEIEAIAAKG